MGIARRFAVTVFLVIGLASPSYAFSSLGVYHGWIMRGQIASIEGGKLVICIGARDQAEVGQILDVVRQTLPAGQKPIAANFKREIVGTVKLIKVFDEHYSEAVIDSGEVKKTDWVELERPVNQ